MTRSLLFATVLCLAACGNPDADVADESADMDAGTDAVVADAAATVMSVSDEGDFITLDHEAIEEINMGAMRMGFEVADGVEISGLEEGDAILFRIEATENDIILTDLCRPAEDGPDCLG